jgi:hypothetical protein
MGFIPIAAQVSPLLPTPTQFQDTKPLNAGRLENNLE